MQVVEPKDKPEIKIAVEAHIRLRHDHALWYPHKKLIKKVDKDKRKAIPNWDASKFDSYQIAIDAIYKSAKFPAYVNEGRLVTVFDMGYLTGNDATRGNRRVSSVTVVTERNGKVVTAHPGLPKKLKLGTATRSPTHT
ncbi:MAG: hypothetical protein AAGI72_15695 [Pseudomonadota bacterium]